MYRKTSSRVPRTQAGEPSISARTVRHRNIPLCRTSQYCPPGSDKVGLTNTNQPSKVVWELDYGLDAKQFEKLSARFPGIAFVQTGTGCHDHPIAHTSYRVVWHNLMKQLKPGQLVADIAGNPAVNETWNRSQMRRENPIKIDTFCQVLSCKDSIRRKTRWGPMMADGLVRWEEMSLYDMYRFEANRSRFAEYDVFLMNHVLYYYDFGEIVKLLSLNKDAVLYATMHKLPGQSGEINCGEQTYVKDFLTGRVTQTNVETGESYSHGDPAPWFKQFAYADENGAIAWTVNKGCEDTYVFTITACPEKLVEPSCWKDGKVLFRDEDTVLVVHHPDAVEQPPAYAVEEVELRTSSLLPGYGEEKVVKVRITHPKLYKTLKHFMINKPRNERTLADLTAKAHREVRNNTYLSQEGKIEIEPDDLTRIIAAAWVTGVGLENDMITLSAASAPVSAYNRTLAGKGLTVHSGNTVKQVARFALLANSVRSSKQPYISVLEQLEALF